MDNRYKVIRYEVNVNNNKVISVLLEENRNTSPTNKVLVLVQILSLSWLHSRTAGEIT